jgi:CBS domain-containing protein
MSADVITIGPDDTVDDAMALMTDRRFRHLPVAVDGKLVGIVSIGDVVKARLEALEEERAALVDYVTRGG